MIKHSQSSLLNTISIWTGLLALIVLAIACGLLVRRNKQLQGKLEHARIRTTATSGNNGPSVGSTFPNIHGVTQEKRALEVDLSHRSAPALLFVLSPSCPYCRVNFHNWRDLAARMSREQVVWIDITGSATDDYTNAEGIPKGATFLSVDDSTAAEHNFLATPTTVLVSPTGTVTWSWSGVLNPPQMNELMKRLSSPN